MDRKLKNTIILLIIFAAIVIGGGLFSYIYLQGKIDDLELEKANLKVKQLDSDKLREELVYLKEREEVMDSILSLRKYNIPMATSETRFYDFINRISFNFSEFSYADVIYQNVEQEDNFSFHKYLIKGVATFNDLYRLIYAIEESKELKKVIDPKITDLVMTDEEGIAKYLVAFNFSVKVYFSDNNLFASSNLRENSLHPNPVYDAFYPLIRNEIPPNTDGLLDVQTGQLLALIPDGAFLSDASGNTFLLWEGDRVYLGYLTKIDYKLNEVTFILNKGGLIEKTVLQLEEKKN